MTQPLRSIATKMRTETIAVIMATNMPADPILVLAKPLKTLPASLVKAGWDLGVRIKKQTTEIAAPAIGSDSS